MFLHPYQFHRLVRVVLAWYVLFVGVSLLSSVVQPRTWDSVCSVAGMVSIAEHDDGSQPAKIMAMECSLCAHTTPVLPPLPALPIGWLVNAALAYALLPITEAILIALTAPPLPSRGPPVSI